MHDLFHINPRTISRADFNALRRSARKGRCSYRLGLSYVGKEVTPCDSSGVIVRGVWHKLQAAQWARAQASKARNAESRARWIAGAREILALPHVAPVYYGQWKFEGVES